MRTTWQVMFVLTALLERLLDQRLGTFLRFGRWCSVFVALLPHAEHRVRIRSQNKAVAGLQGTGVIVDVQARIDAQRTAR